MEQPERPDDNADAAEIARWMQEDWEVTIAEAASAANDDTSETDP